MGMLSRYQKSGGFIQLLKLIETCGTQKRENFLKIIQEEDPRWSESIQQKMLTLEKIFSWDDEVLGDIASRLNLLTLGTLLHSIKPEDWARMSRSFSHSQLRNIEDHKNSKVPSDSELTAAYVKLIEEVRLMINEGYIRLEKVAPEMVIEDDIEEKIGKTLHPSMLEKESFSSEGSKARTSIPQGTKPAHQTPSEPKSIVRTVDKGTEVSSAEVNALRKQVHLLKTENTALKNELKQIKDRLQQIKKIA